MIYRIGAALALGLLLSGCTGLDTTRTAIAAKGAAAADQILIDAEWSLCFAATVGSIKRRYGQTIERAGTYKSFCDGADGVNVIEPLTDDAIHPAL